MNKYTTSAVFFAWGLLLLASVIGYRFQTPGGRAISGTLILFAGFLIGRFTR